MAQEAFSSDTQGFVLKLDEAAQAHMAWTRRVLRCAVLRSSPGDDVLADDAHMRCGLGKWFRQYREQFDVIDTMSAQRLDEQHRQMHDAVRCICTRILDGVAGDAGVLDAFERTQASVIAELSHLKTECLAHSARLDALTGLPLRHGLEDDFRRYRAQAVRRNELLVLVLWDVDHFKRVNDVHGHPAGDLALQHVANSLRLHCRDGEPLFRYGGEEFLALLHATDRAAAQRAVERQLQALRDSPLRLPDGHVLSLRASAGLSVAGPDESVANAVARADLALYAAKRAGRDTWRF